MYWCSTDCWHILCIGPFPPEVQDLIVQSVRGCEHAKISKYAYDVEYDFVDPRYVLLVVHTQRCAHKGIMNELVCRESFNTEFLFPQPYPSSVSTAPVNVHLQWIL